MKAPQPFKIWTTADREASTPKEWIVDGLLGAGEVSGLVAPPTAGKSAIALDLAATIAAGNDWFGRKVVPGAALYFASERGAVTLRRLKAFETFHRVSCLNVGLIRDRLDLLRNAHDAERVLETVRTYEAAALASVKLITIDTARAAMPGGDENSPRDMGNLAQHLGRIRDGAPGAHLQLIHHTPKGRPTEASGHTALTAMLDLVMVVTVSRGGHRTWRVVEANDLPEAPPAVPFSLQTVAVGREGATAPVVIPGSPAQEAAGKAKPIKLPPDATMALDVLRRLVNGGGQAIAFERWREATFDAFGDRRPAAKRQAWSKAADILVGSHVIKEGDTVSVSAPSAERQQTVSADTCHPSAQSSAHPPLEGC